MLRVKPIKDFENYTIREDGKVFNIHGNPVKLTPTKTNKTDSSKYLKFKVTKHVGDKMKTKNCYIHRELGIAFIPNPDNKQCIDHIDRNKFNNDLSNLRWVSHMENTQNVNIGKNNTSGYLNVFQRSNGTWSFQKTFNKKSYHKTFKTKEEVLNYRTRFFKEHNLNIKDIDTNLYTSTSEEIHKDIHWSHIIYSALDLASETIFRQIHSIFKIES